MNGVIVLCLAVCAAGFAALLGSRSQFLQRLGVTGLLLAAVTAGSGTMGMAFADRQMTEQYFSLFTVYFENMYSYAALLEEQPERLTQEPERERLRQWLQESLPVTETAAARVSYLRAEVWELEDGVYRVWLSADEAAATGAVPSAGALAREAAAESRVAWSRLSESEGCLVLCDRNRTTPRYAVAVSIPLWPLQAQEEELRQRYFVYGAVFLAAGSLLAGAVLWLQDREIRKVISLMAAVSEGREDWDRLRREGTGKGIRSSEMRLLYQSLRQMAEAVAKMNYRKYKALQAYYRFAPKEVERILGRESILDVRLSDSAYVDGVLAFVSFSTVCGSGEEEHLRRINNNYALLDRARRTHGGIVLSAENDLDAVWILFREGAEQAAAFGLELTAGGEETEGGRLPFILLHKTSFLYGVAGSERQAYPYIHSGEIESLRRYMDALCVMGIRVAVTERVYEVVSGRIQARYIGFVEGEGCCFPVYEVLDAYPAKERLMRMETEKKFREALTLFYKNDFYLSRNLFTDILKVCPSDAVAKQYVFLCENCLGKDAKETVSHALFPRGKG